MKNTPSRSILNMTLLAIYTYLLQVDKQQITRKGSVVGSPGLIRAGMVEGNGD